MRIAKLVGVTHVSSGARTLITVLTRTCAASFATISTTSHKPHSPQRFGKNNVLHHEISSHSRAIIAPSIPSKNATYAFINPTLFG